jgi:predicted secreted Zn-dependent protease
MKYEDVVAALAANATNWRKASYSQAQNGCVEVASIRGHVGMRDTKLGPASPILAFTPEGWELFTRGVRDGEFEA